MAWEGRAKSKGPTPECRGPRVPGKKIQVITIHNYFCCMSVLCKWMKLLIDLQIMGCKLHKNAFGGRAPPGPARRAIALHQIP